MKTRHLLFLLFIASILASSCTHTPNKLPDTLYKRWNYVSRNRCAGQTGRGLLTAAIS